MTEKERELLAAMADRPSFTAMPVLIYHHEPLQAWTPHQLAPSAAKLVRDGYALRAFSNPGRQSRYRITEAGRAILTDDLSSLGNAQESSGGAAAVSAQDCRRAVRGRTES